MNVLDTATLELKRFHSLPDQPYAILSHTWGEDEVSFQDMKWYGARVVEELDRPEKLIHTFADTKFKAREARKLSIEDMQGFAKIRGACRKAHEEGYKYAWVDTCCIDKTSSTELNEALNSMFKWYEKAAVCYALLDDIPSSSRVGIATESEGLERRGKSIQRPHSSNEFSIFDPENLFQTSKWFTRGWTLQELIAPETVRFFAKDWAEIGSKCALATCLADITGIDIHVLKGHLPRPLNLSRYSAAERLSWAATRQTTRIEDEAYCLLGLFDIHMTLHYGAGRKVFIELQEAILKKTEDYSLLLWRFPRLLSTSLESRDMHPRDESVDAGWLPRDLRIGTNGAALADSPKEFATPSRSVWQYADLEQTFGPNNELSLPSNAPPPLFTGRGLQLSAKVLPIPSRNALLFLNFKTRGRYACAFLDSDHPTDDASLPQTFTRLGMFCLLTERQFLASAPAFETRTIWLKLEPLEGIRPDSVLVETVLADRFVKQLCRRLERLHMAAAPIWRPIATGSNPIAQLPQVPCPPAPMVRGTSITWPRNFEFRPQRSVGIDRFNEDADECHGGALSTLGPPNKKSLGSLEAAFDPRLGPTLMLPSNEGPSVAGLEKHRCSPQPEVRSLKKSKRERYLQAYLRGVEEDRQNHVKRVGYDDDKSPYDEDWRRIDDYMQWET